VLGGGFSLWLGDNISILSMVKQAHLLFLTAPVSGLEYLINFGYFLAWCISLAWLLIATMILLFVKVKVLGGWLRPMVG
jgi:hypothetical protein